MGTPNVATFGGIQKWPHLVISMGTPNVATYGGVAIVLKLFECAFYTMHNPEVQVQGAKIDL